MLRRKIDPAAITHYDGIPAVGPPLSILDCPAYGTDHSLLLQACTAAEREGYLTDEQRQVLEARIQTRTITRGRTAS